MHRLDPRQLCAMNFHYFRHAFDRYLDDVVASGLRQIELWAAAPHFHLGDETLASGRRLAGAVRARGLEIVCFTPEQCLYPVNLAAREEAMRERSLRMFLDSLDLAVEMGIPALLVTPGWGYVGESVSEAWAYSRDGLAILARRAERLGLVLLLEPLTPTESNLINTAQDLRRMIDDIGSPQIHAILDTVAMAVAGDTVADYVRLFGTKLSHVHLIDGDLDGSHLAWGDGSLSLEPMLRDLQAGGYTGALSLEFTSPRYWLEPLTPLRDSVGRIRDAIGKL